MPTDLYDVLLTLQQIGIYDVILPFLLIFTISFGILQRVKILGDHKNINVILSLGIALLFLQNLYLVEQVNLFLANVSFIIIAVIMVLLLLGMFAGEHKAWGDQALTIAFIFSIIAIIVALSTNLLPGEISNWLFSLWYGVAPSTRSLIVFIVVLLIIISVVTGEKKQPGKGLLSEFMKGINKGS